MDQFLADLYADGVQHDAEQPDRLLRRRNLEPDTAALLAMLVRVAGARRVVEIGTSNGYSTIWLARAAGDIGGRVVTVDTQEWPGVRSNLSSAGVSVDLVLADGGAHLAALPSGSVDLLFLDAERTEYAGWWPDPIRVLRPGGVLAIDNVLSHPSEVAPFLALVAADPRCRSTTVPVGKGLSITWRAGA
ncbi:putative O-methyltransferase YrrM [Asanoa ferruginea]|uniref:Putative O-methyltransferase YrrM n=1 Tax=Asanoa ferruginea TaxID=53367 RepID=A0A3D9ZPP8_9ACTN|nr:class I SAM-dependent methyltransferase [Asanoa ferruginea]REF99241.1 putative O-methyltransferase YrrM [Asanoa ferruginea]GIF45838.1 O-methyltransferase [Asanoa ferruginea]